MTDYTKKERLSIMATSNPNFIYVLFVCPDDSTVFVHWDGSIPKAYDVSANNEDSATDISIIQDLMVKQKGVDVNMLFTKKGTKIVIISVKAALKNLATNLFEKHSTNPTAIASVSWVKYSNVMGRNTLLDSVIRSSKISRFRKNSSAPVNIDDSHVRHVLQQAADQIHELSRNIELNSINMEKIEKLIKAVDDLTNDDSGLERITNIVLENSHIARGLDIKTHLDIPAQIEDKINSAWIKRLHDQISARCIREDSVVSDDEMYILHFCLDNANTKLKESQRLTIINTDDILGNRFDSRTMKPTKPTVSGRVARVLLPGIKATEIMKSVVEVSQ